MHVSRSTKLLTNHSWQVWRSIYNNHIDVKISPTMIWVHRKQATKVQGKICLWQNMIMLIKFFGFFTFYVFLDFWHKSKKNWSKETMWKHLKQMQTNKHKYSNQASITTKSTQPSKVTKHRKYSCMDML